MEKFNFSAPTETETYVFGASRPGYPKKNICENDVFEWINFMKEKGIKKIICLLDHEQLSSLCINLLEIYIDNFGRDNVFHFPIKDYTYITETNLHNYLLPVIKNAVKFKSKIVIHCAGGIGRTGHILAAWLVHGRDFTIDDAIESVIKSGRDPLEAIESDNEKPETLIALLQNCSMSK
ncbi:MAG: dual specificity protein phosphatase family protein [Candidatus Delongbacteria bacterium]|nr:dual specificity protein phosphatase family protein [Candidatus Delongbacteria bacterium]MBN2835666.1 dual specificity protein phosphatase family protein [Candidatus Delongbacteria bacterium]